MSEDNKKSILPVSAIDRRLIKSAARQRTPQEMSEDVLGHLSPAQCVDRVKEIVESMDVWTEVESRRLLMFQMQEHLDWLHDNRENDKVLSSIPRMYKLISESLDKSRINLDEVVNMITSTQARLLVSALDSIVTHVVSGLISHGVEVEETLVWSEVAQALPAAINRIEAAVPGD